MATTEKKSSKTKSIQQSSINPNPATTPGGQLKMIPGGSRSPQPLRTQAKRLYESVVLHPEEMQGAGLTTQMTASFGQTIDAFNEAENAAAQSKASFTLGTQAMKAATAEALTFRVGLVASIELAALANPEILDARPLKLSRSRSPQKLVQWFSDTLVVMEAIRPELEKSSTDWFTATKAAGEKLSSALGVHQQQVTQKAAMREKQLTARFALITTINAVCAYGRVAFVGQPAVLKQFNKGYGKRRKKALSASSSTASEKAASSTGASAAAPAPQAPKALAEAAKP